MFLALLLVESGPRVPSLHSDLPSRWRIFVYSARAIGMQPHSPYIEPPSLCERRQMSFACVLGRDGLIPRVKPNLYSRLGRQALLLTRATCSKCPFWWVFYYIKFVGKAVMHLRIGNKNKHCRKVSSQFSLVIQMAKATVSGPLLYL